MYKLKIRVDLDGDFKWKSKYLSEDGDTLTAISEDREKLVNVIKLFYKDFKKNLGGSFDVNEDHFKIKYRDTIYDFENYLYKLLKVYDLLHISFDSGNWSTDIELSKFNKNTELGKDIIKIENIYENMLTINITSDFKTMFNWDLLDQLMDDNK